MMDDGLDIPELFKLSAAERREAWARYKPKPRSRMSAKQKKFRERARRKAKRRRERFEWR